MWLPWTLAHAPATDARGGGSSSSTACCQVSPALEYNALFKAAVDTSMSCTSVPSASVSATSSAQASAGLDNVMINNRGTVRSIKWQVSCKHGSRRCAAHLTQACVPACLARMSVLWQRGRVLPVRESVYARPGLRGCLVIDHQRHAAAFALQNLPGRENRTMLRLYGVRWCNVAVARGGVGIAPRLAAHCVFGAPRGSCACAQTIRGSVRGLCRPPHRPRRTSLWSSTPLAQWAPRG